MKKHIFGIVLAIVSSLTMVSCGDDENENTLPYRYSRRSYFDDNRGLIIIDESIYVYEIQYDRFSEEITGLVETIYYTTDFCDDDGHTIKKEDFVAGLLEDIDPEDYTISWNGNIATITYSEHIYSRLVNRHTLKTAYYDSDGMWLEFHDFPKNHGQDY
ncbi:MAG: hypothetical protein IK117_11240 [Bacteroidales bacterium]|nr:hypothetical protein [Bacteroidales bacterium]